MAKRQNFIVGSTNPNTVVKTAEQLNTAWNKYEVLKSGDLDGVFNAVSDYSNDSSNEIANAIQSLTGSQPTGATQTELAAALTKMREDIETSSLTFKGYIATAEPSSSTYGLVEGNLWINSATLPTSFPIPAASIKEWNGTSWVNYGSTYTVADFDFFRNINDNEGYYWFGGQWTVMSTDMSTDYFTLNQTSGKWEIKTSVNLPGAPTAATPAASDDSTKLATTAWVRNYAEAAGSYANTDLSNLSSTGENISNWSTNVSNCIIEIPQNINLELSGTTLTLKSGSKVYQPNGTPITISSDTTVEDYSAASTGQYMLFYSQTYKNSGYSGVFAVSLSDCVSGATDPSSALTHVWYDTSNNLIKRYFNNSYNPTDLSLPLGIVSITNGTSFTSIDQVFNGFGYIGSTMYVLPGVQALVPNGRNSDGTLKNTLLTKQSVNVFTPSSATFSQVTNIALGSTLSYHTFKYDEAKNINSAPSFMNAGDVTWSNGKITYFAPKTVFHAVDYNESDFVVAFQRPTSANNYTWYRKYKSGWVEQGGSADTSTAVANTITINLPITMADTRYTVNAVEYSAGTGTGGYTNPGCKNKTISSFDLSGTQASSNVGNNWDWEVKGMAQG